MAIENEFLPCLNSWPLLFGVMSVLLAFSACQYIMPRVHEMRAVRASAARK